MTTEQEQLCRAIAEKFAAPLKDKSIIHGVEESIYQSVGIAIAHNQLTTDELKSILNMRLEAIMLFASGLVDFVRSVKKQEIERLSSIH